MTVFDRIERLRKSRGISQGKLEKELGFSNGSISKWKTSMPTTERLQKIAKYFDVSIDYLMTGEEERKVESQKITPRDERDIAKDIDNIIRKLTDGEDGPALYDGNQLTEESVELFKDELEIALRRLKLINKEKYNPNKNKK